MVAVEAGQDKSPVYLRCVFAQAVIACMLERPMLPRPSALPSPAVTQRRPPSAGGMRSPGGPGSLGGASFIAESSVAADAGSVRSSAPSETGSQPEVRLR